MKRFSQNFMRWGILGATGIFIAKTLYDRWPEVRALQLQPQAGVSLSVVGHFSNDLAVQRATISFAKKASEANNSDLIRFGQRRIAQYPHTLKFQNNLKSQSVLCNRVLLVPLGG
jgi:hypothetical protein